MFRAHEDVLGKVRRALAHEPRLDAPRINVTMIGPELLLTGIVDSPEAVRIAEQVTREAAPGVSVDNGLTVVMRQRGHEGISLAQEAAEAFERVRERIPGRPVVGGVTVTDDGEARLHGVCCTAVDRNRLMRAVADVAGLRGVNADDLRVGKVGGADDLRLGDRAEMKLADTAPALAGEIRVNVHDRVAYVRGAVRKEADRLKVLSVIGEMPGIARVADCLEVYQTDEPRSCDAAVEQRIKRALGVAGLPVQHLTVFVEAGIATLAGEIDTPDQEERAIAIAQGVVGVTLVDSHFTLIASHGRAKQGPRENPVRDRYHDEQAGEAP